MDSCASVPETPDSGIRSKTGRLCLLLPVLEGELINEDCPVADNIDSEEENFFDSQAWLRSDSEDEFFSFKGKSGTDNPGTSDCPCQSSSFIESPPFIKAISNLSQEPPPAEEKKELVELFQDPFWSDLLVQHHNILSIYREKELVHFFQDWSWSEQSIIMDHSRLSKTPCIVNRKHLEPSILELPQEFTDLANPNKSRKNSMDGNDRAKKDKSKSKEKRNTCTATRCCILRLRNKKRPNAH